MPRTLFSAVPHLSLKSASALICSLFLAAACSGGGSSGGSPPPPPVVNTAPAAADDADSVRTKSTNQFINVLANDSDADGDMLTITSASILSSSPDVSGGSVTVAPGGGILYYTPPEIFIGQQVIFYSISDGHGGVDHALATVTVSALPVPPLAQTDAFAVLADSSGNSLDALLNDVDRSGGDSLTLTSVSSQSTVPDGFAGTVSIVSNHINYTPATGFIGVETLRYTVRDSDGISATGTALVTVLPVTAPPVALPDVALIATGSSNQLIDVIANDVDLAGGGLTLTSVTGLVTVPPGSNGSFSIVGDQVSYTPPSALFTGLQTATYTVEDVNGQTAIGLLTILVALDVPPLPPLALPDILTVEADSLNNVIAALTNDIDASGTGLTITDASVVQTLPDTAGALASTDGSSVIFTPPPGFSGVATLQYTVEDGNGNTSTAAIIATVLPTALPPVALPDVALLTQDAAATDIDVLANDVDLAGGGLTLTDVSVTSSLPSATHTVAISGDEVRFTPEAGFAGAVLLSYTATDVNGNSAIGVLSIVVSPLDVPLGPVALPDVAIVTEDASATDIAVLANDIDLAGGGLTLADVSVTSSLPSATHTVAISGDEVRFTPEAGFAGAVVISYTVSDTNGNTAIGLLNIVVSPLDLPLPPVALPDVAIASSSGGATSINVLANDIDPAGGGLTLTDADILLAVPSGAGSVAIVGNQIQYTPSLLYIGAVTVTYTATDTNGNTTIGELILTVLL